ncbi:uncharacterized protein BcabD6B2_25920 [Babesia caballi]|uniref:Uncharacterized protein n=1 Tax=Babesia caballi TaxID=5871 RepID=A0AAV4LSB7_BABCB|nr:hypothetical protein BcabD6B2_25920 [Babesia caballi]
MIQRRQLAYAHRQVARGKPPAVQYELVQTPAQRLRVHRTAHEPVHGRHLEQPVPHELAQPRRPERRNEVGDNFRHQRAGHAQHLQQRVLHLLHDRDHVQPLGVFVGRFQDLVDQRLHALGLVSRVLQHVVHRPEQREEGVVPREAREQQQRRRVRSVHVLVVEQRDRRRAHAALGAQVRKVRHIQALLPDGRDPLPDGRRNVPRDQLQRRLLDQRAHQPQVVLGEEPAHLLQVVGQRRVSLGRLHGQHRQNLHVQSQHHHVAQLLPRRRHDQAGCQPGRHGDGAHLQHLRVDVHEVVLARRKVRYDQAPRRRHARHHGLLDELRGLHVARFNRIQYHLHPRPLGVEARHLGVQHDFPLQQRAQLLRHRRHLELQRRRGRARLDAVGRTRRPYAAAELRAAIQVRNRHLLHQHVDRPRPRHEVEVPEKQGQVELQRRLQPVRHADVRQQVEQRARPGVWQLEYLGALGVHQQLADGWDDYHQQPVLVRVQNQALDVQVLGEQRLVAPQGDGPQPPAADAQEFAIDGVAPARAHVLEEDVEAVRRELHHGVHHPRAAERPQEDDAVPEVRVPPDQHVPVDDEQQPVDVPLGYELLHVRDEALVAERHLHDGHDLECVGRCLEVDFERRQQVVEGHGVEVHRYLLLVPQGANRQLLVLHVRREVHDREDHARAVRRAARRVLVHLVVVRRRGALLQYHEPRGGAPVGVDDVLEALGVLQHDRPPRRAGAYFEYVRVNVVERGPHLRYKLRVELAEALVVDDHPREHRVEEHVSHGAEGLDCELDQEYLVAPQRLYDHAENDVDGVALRRRQVQRQQAARELGQHGEPRRHAHPLLVEGRHRVQAKVRRHRQVKNHDHPVDVLVQQHVEYRLRPQRLNVGVEQRRRIEDALVQFARQYHVDHVRRRRLNVLVEHQVAVNILVRASRARQLVPEVHRRHQRRAVRHRLGHAAQLARIGVRPRLQRPVERHHQHVVVVERRVLRVVRLEQVQQLVARADGVVEDAEYFGHHVAAGHEDLLRHLALRRQVTHLLDLPAQIVHEAPRKHALGGFVSAVAVAHVLGARAHDRVHAVYQHGHESPVEGLATVAHHLQHALAEVDPRALEHVHELPLEQVDHEGSHLQVVMDVAHHLQNRQNEVLPRERLGHVAHEVEETTARLPIYRLPAQVAYFLYQVLAGDELLQAEFVAEPEERVDGGQAVLDDALPVPQQVVVLYPDVGERVYNRLRNQMLVGIVAPLLHELLYQRLELGHLLLVVQQCKQHTEHARVHHPHDRSQ